MGLKVTDDGGGDFKDVEPGTHPARCVRIIDLGTQHGEYEGKATVRKQILISWELPTELMDDGRPFMVSKFYTASLGEKANLRKDLEAWRGRAFTDEERAGFDVKSILGVASMLSVVAKPTGKGVKVGSVMKLPKGMELPPATNPLVSFDIDDWSEVVFVGLSDGIKKIIMASDEYKARTGEVVTADGAPW
jgi:hypothetical protein